MSRALPRNTPPMFSRQWEAARDEAKDLDKYCANWDGADADSVPLELIRTTLHLFRGLEERMFPAPDLVYALADGSVMIEWHHHSGVVQTANVRRHRIDILKLDSNGEISSPSEAVPDSVERLSDSTSVDGDAFEYSIAA